MKTTTAVIIIVILVAIGYGVYNARQSTQPQDTATTTDESMNTSAGEDWNINAAGLGILIVKNGTGPAAEMGDTVSVHYIGSLENGTVFESSYESQPITFTLGQGQVIAGWDQGILGMQVGEQRKLNIPPELAYGAVGNPPKIPSNAVLLFDVELVDLQ